MSQYFVLHLTNVSSACEDFLSQQAFEWGALGMSEVLPFDQPEGEEEVFTRVPDRRAIDIYFESAPQSGLIELVRSRFPEVNLRVQSEENKDWLAEWKKGFKPFRLVGGHFVVPSWCEPPADCEHAIWIDPGMAFGTGTHETTQLVAETLAELVPSPFLNRAAIQKGTWYPESLLDVGTGTGILAILAKQLGVRTVHATEIEPDARRVAHENFQRNKFKDIQLDERQVGDLAQKYDIVVANIIDGVLIRIQDQLKARVKPGGWLVLSGIITEREQDFLGGFKADWKIRRQKGDWLLYAVKL